MSATTGAIRVRTMPKVTSWQALLLALAMALSLMLGLVIGRATSTETTQVLPGPAVTFNPGPRQPYMSSHVTRQPYMSSHVIPRPTAEAGVAIAMIRDMQRQ